MPKVTYSQTMFSSGEISPRMYGRTDSDKYKGGLQLCENAIILPHGGLTRRTGLEFIHEVKDSTKLVELIPFEFSEDQAYVLEFGDQYMRVYMDGGIVVTPDSYTKLLLHCDGTDGSISFDDKSASNHTVTASGNAQVDTAAYYFSTGSLLVDGTGDYLSVPDHADFNFGAGTFTIDTWVRFNGITRIETIYYQADATAGDMVWLFVDCPAQKIVFRVVDTSALVVELRGTFAPTTLTWYHVAVVQTATAIKLYVNGVEKATSGNITMPDHDQSVLLGGGIALTKVFDMSPTAKVVTDHDGATISATASKFGSGSMYFDGTNDYYSLADHADWDVVAEALSTVSFWVKFSDHVGAETIVSHYQDVNNYWWITNTHGTDLEFRMATAGVTRWRISAPEIADTDWHHIAFINSGDQFGLFIDGEPKGYAANTSNYAVDGELRIGTQVSGGQQFQGYIDDFRITHANSFSVDTALWLLDSSGAAHGYGSTAGLMRPSTATPKWGTGSFYFDGSDDDVNFPDSADWEIANQANFTVDFWVQFADHTGTDDLLSYVLDANNYWELRNVHGTGIQFLVATGGVVRYTLTATEISDTNWHHIALIKVGSDFGIYDNGVQTGYQSDANLYDTGAAATLLHIGNFNGASAWFGGYIDEVRITHANTFTAAPVVGLTDTITVPTGAHVSDANTKLLLHANPQSFPVPTVPHTSNADTVLLLRSDLYSMKGWIDELRVSKGAARWSAAFTPATTEYPGGGGSTTYELATPYYEDDVADLRVVQSTDTLYIVHPDFNVRKLQRSDHDDWTISEIDWNQPPWGDTNTTATTLDPAAVTGTGIAVVASAPFFSSTMVGSYFYMTNGFFRITSVSDSTNAVCDIKDDLTDHNATASWKRGVWDADQGYPTAIAFHEDRLVLAGSEDYPLTVFLSKVGDYEDFGISSPVVDDDGLSFSIWSQQQNKIKWLMSGKRLFVGTVGSEFWVTGATMDTPITPSSIQAKPETRVGSEGIAPLMIDNALIFVQDGGERLRLWSYTIQSDGFETVDLSVLSEHLTASNQIYKMQYAQFPDSIVWCTTYDGTLLGLTILKENKVVGWHQHTTHDESIESIAVIPGTSGDELWVVAARTVGGSTKRYVERMHEQFYGDAIATAFFVDSGLSYSGAPATVFTGMDHLEGETVQVLADGIYVGDETIATGGFTLSSAASVVHAGLAYNTNIKTLPWDYESKGGTTDSVKKRIVNLVIKLYESSNLQFGKDSSNLLTLTGMTDGTLYSQWFAQEFNGDFQRDPTVYIRQNEPLPLTLLSIVADVELGGK